MKAEREEIKISVVVPMYNSEKTIEKVLDSVAGQTYIKNIEEVIIVNDGSTDNSLELVNKYKETNKTLNIIVIDKKNGGVSSARNAGMVKATGNWIALLDSDDIWLPSKIEKQVKTILKHPDIDFLGGDADDIRLKIGFRKINKLYKANIKDLCIKSFPNTSTIVFRKSVIDTIGLFDEKQKYAEDGNYYMRICNKFNYYHLPVTLINYGFGKRGFGESGLSANLKGMYDGNVKNIKELKADKIISSSFYYFLRVFFWLKYIRRIVITKYCNSKKRKQQG